VRTSRVLTTLLDDSAAAAKVYDAAVRYTYDRVGAADTSDTLGGEVWDAGSLFGLLLTADARAKVDDAKERIARREALLDAIGQITDLGLTLTKGRWIPFAKTGRDALIDSFRNDNELDRAWGDVDAFEAELRHRLSIVLAIRMVQNGDLRPPPGGLRPFDRMTPQQRTDFNAWLNSDHVRDAITSLRTQAGERMDEVERLLPEPG
jgi:hypothetical protein